MSEQLSYRGADRLTPFQVLARVNAETGLSVRASREERLVENLFRVVATDVMIKLLFKVNRYRSTRQGRVATEEGLRAVVLVRVGERWSVLTDLTHVSEVEDPVEEIYRGRVETADEAVERVAYEEMCHRPGNSRFPMDTPSRVAQRKRLGI